MLAHFTIDADWLTDHIRSLWAEGSFTKSYRTLTAAFPKMSQKDQEDIIRGKKKLVKDKKDDTLVCLVKDKWKPDLSRCQCSRYPDPKDILDLASKGIKAMYELEKLEQQVDDDRYEVVRRVAQEQIEAWQPLNVQHRASTTRLVDGTPFSVDDFAKSILASDNDKDPEPAGDVESPNGWVDRMGNYYACAPIGHQYLAEKLRGSEEKMEEEGWVKIHTSIFGCHILETRIRATKEQRETVLEWCAKHKQPIPSWMKGES